MPSSGSKTARARLKRKLLLSQGVLLLLLLAVFLLVETLDEQKAMETERERTMLAVLDAFSVAVERDSDKLGAVLDTLAHNSYNRSLFLTHQRDQLYASTRELFEELKRNHDITHFYFIGSDRRMFLRVPRPDSHGDVIERSTLLQAERSGEQATGLELGQQGVLTLRVVQPWLDAVGQRIGYIELGKELDRTLSQLQTLTGAEVFLLVDKRYLDRPQWEDGMTMVGASDRNWDLLPNMVVASRSAGASDAILLAHPALASVDKPLDDEHYQTQVGDRRLEYGSLPLNDASARQLGTVVIVHDLSATATRHSIFMITALLATLFLGGALLAIGSRLVDRAGGAD